MKPQPVSFFEPIKTVKQNSQFHPVFTWNCATSQNKNKCGLYWNLIFSIKQPIKSRAKFLRTAQFQKNCKNSAYQKQALISLENTRIYAVFEIRSQLKISWWKLVWNCETGGSDSVNIFHKITNISVKYNFTLIF